MDLIKGGQHTSMSPLFKGERMFDLFTQALWAWRLVVLPVVRTGNFSVLFYYVSYVLTIFLTVFMEDHTLFYDRQISVTNVRFAEISIF